MGNTCNNQNKSLLRFTTAGSVDDGKSTLIGRLLYDSKSIFEDQLDHIAESSRRLGKEYLDLSLLTDGLRAEREQGITIDVAYRYFATPSRKFIIADTPGHLQYTRNMVTGASTADLAVILTDARKGVLEQTLRHSFIARLLGIKHIIFCVNKMDLIDYSENRFFEIKNELAKLTIKLDIENAYYVPISAKFGDNIVDPSANMDWYKGATLLRLLETIEVKHDRNSGYARFPVQTILRPLSDEFQDYRGYAGRVAGGTFKVGDEIIVLPSMLKTRIKEIHSGTTKMQLAPDGCSVAITLEDHIDISRGDMIVKSGELPVADQEITLMACWFNEKELKSGGRYLVRHNTAETACIVRKVNHKMNINTLQADYNDLEVRMNDIANISIRTSKPLFYDSYSRNSTTGSLVFIDEGTNETVGAGMII